MAISILDFNLTDRPEYHTIYRFRDQEGHEFTDILEVHIIELGKQLEGDNPVDDWIRFFNSQTKEDLDMLKTNNPGILEAIRELTSMSLSKRFRLEYEAYLKAKRDERAMSEYDRAEARSLGLAEGRAEGRLEGRLEGIRACLSLCKELDIPAACALQKVMDKFQLPEEEAQELLNKYW